MQGAIHLHKILGITLLLYCTTKDNADFQYEGRYHFFNDWIFKLEKNTRVICEARSITSTLGSCVPSNKRCYCECGAILDVSHKQQQLTRQ